MTDKDEKGSEEKPITSHEDTAWLSEYDDWVFALNTPIQEPTSTSAPADDQGKEFSKPPNPLLAKARKTAEFAAVRSSPAPLEFDPVEVANNPDIVNHLGNSPEKVTSGSTQNAPNQISVSFPWGWAGEVVDLWSDLIEGQGKKENEFLLSYRNIIGTRGIPGVSSRSTTFTTKGIFIRTQQFEIFRWKVAKAALRTEQMGDDLYVSWRVFVAEAFSLSRMIAWLMGCLLISVFLTVGFNLQNYLNTYNVYYSPINPYIQATFETYIKVLSFTGIWLGLLGLFRRNGDVLGMFRRPLDEFDRDDAMAAAHIVHKSVMQAADQIGIDSAVLMPREPAKERRKMGFI